MEHKIRRLIPADLRGNSVQQFQDGPTRVVICEMFSRPTLCGMYAETVEEALYALDLDPMFLQATPCLARLYPNGHPPAEETLHKDESPPNGVGAWLYSGGWPEEGEFLVWCDGQACYRFEDVGFIIRRDEPRMLLGGSSSFRFTQVRYGIEGDIPRHYPRVILEDINLVQMAARFGLSYPLP